MTKIITLIAVLSLGFYAGPGTASEVSCETTNASKQKLNYFNSLPSETKTLLIQSCRSVWSDDLGWTNSATGCGKCPLSENSIKTDSVVKIGQTLQDSLLAYQKTQVAKLQRESKDQVENIEMLPISLTEDLAAIDKYKQHNMVEPSIDGVYSSLIGKPMLVEKKGYLADCVIPKFSVDKNARGAWKFRIFQGHLLCKKNKKSKDYSSNYFNLFSGQKNFAPYTSPYRLKNKKGVYEICIRHSGMSMGCEKDLEESDFVFVTGFVTDKRLQSRSLSYQGRNGSLLNFIDNLNGSIDEVQLDLHNTSVLNINGAVIKIIETDDTQITFSIIQNFTNRE